MPNMPNNSERRKRPALLDTNNTPIQNNNSNDVQQMTNNNQLQSSMQTNRNNMQVRPAQNQSNQQSNTMQSNRPINMQQPAYSQGMQQQGMQGMQQQGMQQQGMQGMQQQGMQGMQGMQQQGMQQQGMQQQGMQNMQSIQQQGMQNMQGMQNNQMNVQQNINNMQSNIYDDNMEVNDGNDFSDLNSVVTDDINRSNEKKKKAKIAKQQKEIEKKNKVKSIIPIIIGAAAACVVIVIVVVVLRINQQNSDYVLNLIDSGVIVAQQPVFEDTSNKFLVSINNNKENNSSENNNESEENEQPKTTRSYNVVEISGDMPLKAGETILIDTVVNTKETGETSYSDHETQFYFTFDKFETDYDTIAEIINQFNDTSNNKINIPSKADYTAANLQLILVEAVISYPENFPTNNSDGKVYDIPNVEANIKGLCEEELADEDDLENSLDRYILFEEMIYDVTDFTALNNTITDVDIHNEYSFKFITSLPIGVSKDLYKITLNLKTNSGIQTIIVDGK